MSKFRHAPTSRELRRMNEREAKKQEREQEVNRWLALSPEQGKAIVAENKALSNLERNGITVEDVMRMESDAYKKGVDAGKNATLQTCFAAICLCLNENYDFDSDKCQDVLNDVYDRMCYSLTSADAIQEVMDKMGLQITFSDDITQEMVEKKED